MCTRKCVKTMDTQKRTSEDSVNKNKILLCLAAFPLSKNRTWVKRGSKLFRSTVDTSTKRK